MSQSALVNPSGFAAAYTSEYAELEGLGFRVLGFSSALLEQFFLNNQTFIFDIDGVLLWGNTPLKGAAETLQVLRRYTKRIVFLTNTAAKTRKQLAEQLNSAGIEAHEHEVSIHPKYI